MQTEALVMCFVFKHQAIAVAANIHIFPIGVKPFLYFLVLIIPFAVGGVFKYRLRLGQLAISIRCGCISLSYGILVVHFVYRYIALFHPHFVYKVLQPRGIAGILLFFFAHGVVWTAVCELFLYGDREMSEYVRKAFDDEYGVDSDEIAILGATYLEGSDELRKRSWAGILILTGISTYAVSVYVALGFKIVRKLQNNPALSNITRNMHKQLFKALAVQTFIPICISFSPCMVAWYGPLLSLNLGMWNNYLGVIALSAFPFLDPLAIIVLLHNYRNRLMGAVPWRPSTLGTSSFRHTASML
ncbi:unnamed protein product [Caenorhabditis sp. 36 PRJEB53466]|nr:unnamed protein product [Caenorhabditis sp. 36 PRJEB53466]